MPIFINNEEKFLEVAKKALECRVKRVEKKGIAKVKARTKRYLYTYIIALDKLEELLSRLKNICNNIKEI
uniref:5'-nucleotidase n=1 Tax=Ignisphaera aggregans TaxID=334771 RepID=A0A7C5XLM3_9CREN